MAQDDERKSKEKESSQEKQVIKRLDLLEERLDNVDSIVTAVAERVMRQPMSLSTTCPHCGKRIEISLLGNQKGTK